MMQPKFGIGSTSFNRKRVLWLRIRNQLVIEFWLSNTTKEMLLFRNLAKNLVFLNNEYSNLSTSMTLALFLKFSNVTS